ncbi:PepSY-associated TM helix domain-containing protein [Parapedobacter sp. DT-150]|uniref:PepSY-associated TM helix domain-containing protein n=1 Tax=Parapedobacter sp. DT-150 TaxID=3396162 RepID=UPI003F1D61C2
MKGLGPRAYNILFHTHTVTGIVISAALFVIFFAGAITLFKYEFYQWEDRSARIPLVEQIDYEQVIQQLDSIKPGVSRADEIQVRMPTREHPLYLIYAPVEDSTATAYTSFRYHPMTGQAVELNQGNGTTVGETLYRLHFLDQIPFFLGRYLAGFVSLFFAFAVVTGVLVHWRNIVAKFYAFSFKQAKKQLWTNAHTIFGLIGLPFQLMYAITGVFYLLNILVLAPAVFVLYGGSQQEIITMLYPPEAFHSHDSDAAPAATIPIAEAVERIRSNHPDYTIEHLEIINPGKENAMLGADLVDHTTFNGDGLVMMDLTTGEYKLEIKPGSKSYIQSMLTGISRLHFATFGGWLLKALFFVLSIFSCFVIISGILIWKEARNKPAYTDRQRRFHHRVTMLYLAVCFGLFPAIAVLFIAEQVVPMTAGHADTVNAGFFFSWLLFSFIGCFLRNEARVTRFNLWLGGVLSLLVPVANGVISGGWMWQTAGTNPYVFGTDLCWLLTGLAALGIGIAGVVSRKVTKAWPMK